MINKIASYIGYIVIGLFLFVFISGFFDSSSNIDGNIIDGEVDYSQYLTDGFEEVKSEFNEIKLKNNLLNESEIKNIIYEEINKIRTSKNLDNLMVVQSMEKKAIFCSKHFDDNYECLIEYEQEGVSWEIPWYSSVCDYGSYVDELGDIYCTNSAESNCLGNKNNALCFIDSLAKDNEDSRIFDYIIKSNKIGVGIFYDEISNNVYYNIILE
jgi:hypothetical protein